MVCALYKHQSIPKQIIFPVIKINFIDLVEDAGLHGSREQDTDENRFNYRKNKTKKLALQCAQHYVSTNSTNN